MPIVYDHQKAFDYVNNFKILSLVLFSIFSIILDCLKPDNYKFTFSDIIIGTDKNILTFLQIDKFNFVKFD